MAGRARIQPLDQLFMLARQHGHRSPGIGIAAVHHGCPVFAEGAPAFFDDPLPKWHDLLLLANILHDWETAECRRILAACHDAIEPGGTIVVVEPMLAEDLSGPDHASVSGLTMALLGGENRTQSRIGELLEGAGFDEVWQSAVGEQNSVVTARKPGAGTPC